MPDVLNAAASWPGRGVDARGSLHDTGRIYNRDLDELSAVLTAISVSMTRRLYIRSGTASRPH